MSAYARALVLGSVLTSELACAPALVLASELALAFVPVVVELWEYLPPHGVRDFLRHLGNA